MTDDHPLHSGDSPTPSTFSNEVVSNDIEALRWREAHLRQAQAVAKIGSWFLDVKNDDLRWSEEVYAIFDFPRDESPSFERFLEMVHPEDRGYVGERWEAALEGEPYDIEHRIVVDGETRWVRERADVTFDDDGEPVEGIGIVQDITERKRREQDLRSFREAVENAGHSIYITDTDGRIEYVNRALVEQTGYNKSELIGQNPRKLKSGRHGETFYDDLWETIQAGDVWRAEVTNRRKSGELFTVDQTIAPVTDDGGEIVRYVAVNTDITERKRRRQALEVYNRVLRHNLRNEVNVIAGHASLLVDQVTDRIERAASTLTETVGSLGPRKGNADEQPQASGAREDVEAVAEQLVDIARDVENHAGIIEDVGEDLEGISETVRRAERGVDVGSAPTIDCNSMIQETTDRLEEEYPEATFSVNGSSCREIGINESVTLVLEEILENAVEHNDRENPHVSVESWDTSDAIHIRVVDDGPGLPDYERTVLEEGRETPLDHGSGLGLWMVNWIVNRLGGSLEIEDADPRGTSVTLSIPTASEAL